MDINNSLAPDDQKNKYGDHESSVSAVVQRSSKPRKIITGLCIFVASLVFVNFFFLSAPANFPLGSILEIEKGMNLRSVSLKLKEDNIIRSRLAFEAFVIIYGGEKRIRYSGYSLEEKLPVYVIASRIVRGEHRTAPVVVTIPEGFNTLQIADLFGEKLVNFDKEGFLHSAEDLEGYLFPDTYFFFTTATEDDVLESMSKNFNHRIESLREDIIASGRTEEDIVIMASIIEGEAKGEQDRAFISGILWKRLSLKIPLQVDVSPETYKSRGLPDAPIGNPGLAALEAAIHPEESTYLYYLHDKDGNIYYSKNFEGHKKNVSKYLK